jgi:hypothetical protein
MPSFTINDPASGRTITVRGDVAPTPEDITEIFASLAPELVAGNKQQMEGASARNLQAQMGLKEPVSTETIPAWNRAIASFAPTAVEEKAYYESVYGPGNFKPISNSVAIVKTVQPDGTEQWRPTNRPGFDLGDIAALAGTTPQMITGAVTASSVLPGPGSAAGRIVKASGLSAAASSAMGGLQDVAFRLATDTPVNVPEIAARRGMGAGLEFLTGMAVPVIGAQIIKARAANSAVRNYIKAFTDEGKEAKKFLRDAGVKGKTAADAAEFMRLQQTPLISPNQAGNAIADSLNKMDDRLRAASQRAAGSAASAVEQKAMSAMPLGTTAVSAVDAGNIAAGGAKSTLLTNRSVLDMEIKDILGQIESQAANNPLAGKFFVSLDKTGDAVSKFKQSLARSDDGEVSALLAPMFKTINEFERVVGAGQSIEAMRRLRTSIGAKIGGGANELFPGMETGQLKVLYKTISEDIDNSISKFSGPLAKRLQAYNANYKALVQSVEDNDFLNKLVHGGFDNPEMATNYLANSAGTADWAALRNALPAPAFNKVRQSVAQQMIGNEGIEVAGTKVANLPVLSKRLSGMEKEVKDIIFGNRGTWEMLERAGSNISSLVGKKSVFEGYPLPSVADLDSAIKLADSGNLVAGSTQLAKAVRAASARRENLGFNLVSLVRNGSIRQAAENPEALVDGLLASGAKYGPNYISSTLNKLDPSMREQVGRVAFQKVFERSKDIASSTISSNKNLYDTKQLAQEIFGTSKQKQAALALLGRERYDLLENWTKWTASLAVKEGRESTGGRKASSLIAVAPYQNLFGARLASFALEKASGKSLISKTSPELVVEFSKARLLADHPVSTASAMSLVQRAFANPMYGTYLEMMDGFTPEQQNAIDEYLTGVKLGER